MANEGDIAQEAENFERELNIKNALLAQTRGPKATGFCLYCDTPQKLKEQRWCDNYCRDDWQDEENARRRATGGPLIADGSLKNLS